LPPARSLAQVVAGAAPAVVTIIADLPPATGEEGEAIVTRNIGSGVVIDRQGYIVTNAHVITGATAYTVLLADGSAAPARLVGLDWPYSDLAVLIAPAGNAQPIAVGSSAALLAGDQLVAIGANGFTLDPAVRAGVVSATGVAWPRNGVIYEDLIQTDAAINNGDSGGALLNAAGELVGIITTVVREGPNNQPIEGVAFAQSIDALRPIIEGIIRDGGFPRQRPGIELPGVQHAEITEALAAQLGLPVSAGALIVEPAAQSTASAAGIQPGDIVVAVNGVAIDFQQPLVNLLKALPPDAPLELAVLRNGEQLVIPISPAQEQ